MPNAPAQAAGEGLPLIKITRSQDAISEARHFVQAMFMAAGGLGSREDMNAIQFVANEVERRLINADDLLEELKGARA